MSAAPNFPRPNGLPMSKSASVHFRGPACFGVLGAGAASALGVASAFGVTIACAGVFCCAAFFAERVPAAGLSVGARLARALTAESAMAAALPAPA